LHVQFSWLAKLVNQFVNQFGQPIWSANLAGQFGELIWIGSKLTLVDEYFYIQLWIKVHNFLQFFTLHRRELVVQKRSDCCAFDSKII